MVFLAPGMLQFKGLAASGLVFTMHTKAHPVTLPERSYARSALAMRRNAIIASLRGTIVTAMAAE
jgi:hypothetical protein